MHLCIFILIMHVCKLLLRTDTLTHVTSFYVNLVVYNSQLKFPVSLYTFYFNIFGYI